MLWHATHHPQVAAACVSSPVLLLYHQDHTYYLFLMLWHATHDTPSAGGSGVRELPCLPYQQLHPSRQTLDHRLSVQPCCGVEVSKASAVSA